MKTTSYKTSQKHPKGLYKPLKIATTFTSIDRFQIPKGAVYGRITPNMYIYVSDFEQFKIERPKYTMFLLDMRSDNNFRRVSLTKNNFAYEPIISFIKAHNLIGSTCSKYYNNTRKYYTKNGEVAGAPRERLIPQPESRIYKQSMVDGKDYSLDWEYENHKAVNSDGTPYTGIPAEKKMQFNQFEGIDYKLQKGVCDDYADTKYKDGMKVNQTKIRPEKNKDSKKVNVRVYHENGTFTKKTV